MKLWLVSGFMAAVLSLAVHAQGIVFGADRDKTLEYALQEGLPQVRDRYTLIFKTLAFPTTSVQIIYFADYDGQIDPQQVRVRGKVSGTDYPVADFELDRSIRTLTLQFKEPIPRGEIPEVLLNQVINPSSDGFYQFRARVLENGAFPSYRYIGDWFITIGAN